MISLKNKILCSFIFSLISAGNVFCQTTDAELIRCGSVEREAILIQNHPELLRKKEESQLIIQNYLSNLGGQAFRMAAVEEVVIPVVVHVVYNTTAIGNQQGNGSADDNNILDSQVKSQIEVLNEDYARLSGTNTFYSDSLGVDTKIRFELVNIVHQYTSVKEFNPLTDAAKLASISSPWRTDRYLNIWVCKLASRYLGSAQFPAVERITNGTEGLGLEKEDDNYDTDGIIIDYRYFGREGAPIVSKLYNLGRTTTHEVGHWLGLIHIWGDAVCGNDYCEDTPTAKAANQVTDLECVPVFSTCRGAISRNMIDNYMDYSPDQCMGLFTQNQTDRMHAVISLSKRRAKLIEFGRKTDTKMAVTIYPNPVLDKSSEFLVADVYTPNYQAYTIEVFNSSGNRVVGELENAYKINVRNFASGIYFIRVSSGSQTITKRFVIQ